MNTLIQYGASQRFLNEATLYPQLKLARVTSQYKDLYRIITDSGEALAEVSGRFRYEAACLSDYPAVGDFVMVDHSEEQGNRIIHKVLTRKSAFERAAVGLTDQVQVVAANIDLLFICMSLNYDYNLSRLERYLSVAWDSRATPVVVLTKADLCSDLPKVLAEIASVAVGADILTTSCYDQSAKEQLSPYLKAGMTASFIGSSGVGKSTLINLLAEQEVLATSAIREDDSRGRHTSTRRELLILPEGGIVIDTPGMRELGIDSADLSKSFADIDALSARCRFADCTHGNEPGCAVREALESGQLELRRLQSYQKLKTEARYDGLSSKQIEKEKLNRMFGGTAGAKRARDYFKHKNQHR